MDKCEITKLGLLFILKVNSSLDYLKSTCLKYAFNLDMLNFGNIYMVITSCLAIPCLTFLFISHIIITFFPPPLPLLVYIIDKFYDG